MIESGEFPVILSIVLDSSGCVVEPGELPRCHEVPVDEVLQRNWRQFPKEQS